jgi:hypothetical protein
MDKKILYIGIAVLVVALLVLLFNISNTSSIASGFSNVLVQQNISVSSGGFASLTLNSSNVSFLFIIAELSKPANLYFMNQSGYTAWSAGIGANRTGLKEAVALEGNGVLAVYANAVNATIPPQIASSAAPLYIFNQSGLYPKGHYYFLVDNTNGSESAGSPITAKFVYVPPFTNSTFTTGQFANLSSQIDSEVVYGAVFFVLLVAGIVVLLYGFFKKPKGQPPNPSVSQKLPANADQAYVDKLYQNIEKRKKAKKKKA